MSVISARLDYLPAQSADPEAILADPEKADISRYALGRDYHKVLRYRMQKQAARIEQAIGEFGYHGFTDSAPVLENTLVEFERFAWDEETFLNRTEGSPIRRIGYECWLRNISVALGNTPGDNRIQQALEEKVDHPSDLVRKHVQWAINQTSC